MFGTRKLKRELQAQKNVIDELKVANEYYSKSLDIQMELNKRTKEALERLHDGLHMCRVSSDTRIDILKDKVVELADVFENTITDRLNKVDYLGADVEKIEECVKTNSTKISNIVKIIYKKEYEADIKEYLEADTKKPSEKDKQLHEALINHDKTYKGLKPYQVLRGSRNLQGFSMLELAKEAGVSESTVSRVERGISKNKKTIKKIKDALLRLRKKKYPYKKTKAKK